MDTKNLVIFGAGVIAGYLLVDYLRKNPMGTTPTNGNIPLPTIPTIPTIESCQASLDEQLQTIKMMPENLEAYKKEFMDNCLKVDGTPCTKVVGGVVGILPGVYNNGVCVIQQRGLGEGGDYGYYTEGYNPEGYNPEGLMFN